MKTFVHRQTVTTNIWHDLFLCLEFGKCLVECINNKVHSNYQNAKIGEKCDSYNQGNLVFIC